MPSPTDITHFFECRHSTAKNLGLQGQKPDPVVWGEFVRMVIDRGNVHETNYLKQLVADKYDIAHCAPHAPGRTRAQALALTRQAMADGKQIIYQAALEVGDWYGIADFLIRRELPPGEESALGNHVYEPVDAKLARNDAMPHHVLQLSVYARAIEAIQGRPPEFIHVRLARADDPMVSIRLAEVDAYCELVAEQLEAFVANPPATEPYPVSHCSFCEFHGECEAWWEETDHLSRVAGITRSQVAALRDVGVATLAELAALDPLVPPGPAFKPLSFRRIQEQAALQDASRGVEPGDEKWAIVDASAFAEGYDGAFGFRRLPPPHPSDVILDLEGHPLWTPEEGLVFLFGYLADRGSGMEYHAIWVDAPEDEARAREREAFEEFMDFLVSERRGEEHRGWHLYHYGNAETTMLKALSQRHGTRELELDHLLRSDLLVDLSTIVRQGVRIGVDSYSLKRVEKVAGYARAETLSKGAAAVIEYEGWMGDGDRTRLEAIEHYNAEDCRATLAVRDWLESLRPADEQYTGREEVEPVPPRDSRVARLDLRERILARFEIGTPEALAAELIPYHQREQRPEYWAYYSRRDELTLEELVADSEALAGLEYAADIDHVPILQSEIVAFRFDEQEHKISTTSRGVELLWSDRSISSIGEVTELNGEEGIVRLKLGATPLQALKDHGDPMAIIPGQPLRTETVEVAVARFAEALTREPLDAEKGVPSAGYPALEQLLRREPPRLRDRRPGDPVQTTDLEEILRLVEDLDGGALVVQGPPGTGKTWTGARMILHLHGLGKRIAITATAHKAIDNVIVGIEKAAREAGMAPGSVEIARQQGGDPDDVAFAPDSPVAVRFLQSGDLHPDPARIVAGTAWPLTGPDWDVNNDSVPDERKIDHLFVDEAGQFSLANAIAVGTCARNIVLLGDPLQLPQVAKGVHPHGADRSVLQHFLGGSRTVAPTHGLFLEESWRMHPVICGFVSERIYEGRLRAEADCARQSVDGRALLAFRPVSHSGNGSRSPEEAQAIAGWIEDLLGKQLVDRGGETRDLVPEDVMVVTPYNAQIRELRRVLPAGVQIGTVDSFQGREAPVVFYSMATSDQESMPRSVDFLFSPNRLNVAVSRAQTHAAVVASLDLLSVPVKTVGQMRDVSLLGALSRHRGMTQ